MAIPFHEYHALVVTLASPYVSGSGKRDLMAQNFFLELLIQSSSTIFEL